MYPAELLDLFPAHPRTNMVFVAMSFDSRFDRLWHDVFEKAVETIEVDGAPLKAHRVDLSRKSDAIITEIVRNIAECRLVLADVSTLGWHWRGLRRARAIRNANVMYEVGIAHACRLSEEVILVRGDSDPLDFDVAGVRVHQYPHEADAARVYVRDLISDALKSIDQRRSLAVQRALRGLTPPMYIQLHSFTDIQHPKADTVAEALGQAERLDTVGRLLDAGLIEAVYKPLSEGFMGRPVADLFTYRATPFGRSVYQAARLQMHFNQAFQKFLDSDDGLAWIAKNRPQGAESEVNQGDA